MSTRYFGSDCSTVLGLILVPLEGATSMISGAIVFVVEIASNDATAAKGTSQGKVRRAISVRSKNLIRTLSVNSC